MFPSRLKIVAIGDEKVGKTNLIHFLMGKPLPETYSPTTYDNTLVDKIVCGSVISISFRDTAGRPTLDSCRSLVFGNADLFLLCFSSQNRESFINLKDKWIEEARTNVPNAKIILVETKCDENFDPLSIDNLISDFEIKNLILEENIDGFAMCSAKSEFQNPPILEMAAKMCLFKRKYISNPKVVK